MFLMDRGGGKAGKKEHHHMKLSDFMPRQDRRESGPLVSPKETCRMCLKTAPSPYPTGWKTVPKNQFRICGL